jgi:Sulfotransferase family
MRPFFIVGSPRSGTTLLRQMLDGHPRLAIPDESHFVVGLAPRWWRRRRAVTVDDVLAHPRVARWDVPPDELRAGAAVTDDAGFAEVVGAVFGAYASAHGKARWGDKTPGYVTHLPFLADLFPDSQFVHVLRDGREVAASLADWSWGPPSAVSGAFWWVHKVQAGRRAGRRLPADRYLEVRLEDLIADPEATLREVCRFLGEEYDPALLDYPDRVAAAGPGPAQERHLVAPPTPGLRAWRDGLPNRAQEAVEQVCRRTLADLGYPVPPRRRQAWPYAVAVRARDLVVTAPAALRARLSPETREF